jgi:hypothetical protein
MCGHTERFARDEGHILLATVVYGVGWGGEGGAALRFISCRTERLRVLSNGTANSKPFFNEGFLTPSFSLTFCN